MLKSKICFTVFVLYEVIAVILLHCQNTCNAMFGGAFCSDSGFKYFLICAAIPMLAWVLMIWIHEIFFARRRRSFLHRARDVVDDVADGVKKHLGRAFDARDMDKYLAAAILFGIKKYSDRHPKMRNTIRDIIDGADSRGYSYDDADEDGYTNPAPRRATAAKSTRTRSASNALANKKRSASKATRRTSR